MSPTDISGIASPSPGRPYQLHHVGVVIHDFDEAAAFMRQMELTETFRGRVEAWQCWCIFTQPLVGAAIELVVPEGGPLQRFNRGVGGVHHFAYQVDDIRAEMARYAAKGMEMIEPEPIKGAGDFLCNFLSPISTRGVQIELVQVLDVARPANG